MPAEEILCGAKPIAAAIGLPPRAVYHHASAGRLPVFRVGRTLCARPSELRAWLAARRSTTSSAAA